MQKVVTFLKRHYEKLILLFLLVIFIFSLIYLIYIIIRAQTAVTIEDLEIQKPKPDYVRFDFSNPEYNVKANLKQDKIWIKSLARAKRDAKDFYTDLLNPITAAKCPNCKHIIPRWYFNNKQCPYCGKILKKPPGETVIKVPDDADVDGIPDKLEAEHGLSNSNKEDALYDKDKDGFSNIDEYNDKKFNTEFWNPKSRPPLAYRLSVAGVQRTKLSILLKKVMASGEDKKKWMVQLEIYNKGRWRTRFKYIGNSIIVNGNEYIIKNVIYRTKKVWNRNIKNYLSVDDSLVDIQAPGSDDVIRLQIMQPVYSPRKDVVFRDYLNNKSFKVVVGRRFTIGDDNTGFETYELVAIGQNQTGNIATIKMVTPDGKLGPPITIGPVPKAEKPKSPAGAKKDNYTIGDMGGEPAPPGPPN